EEKAHFQMIRIRDASDDVAARDLFTFALEAIGNHPLERRAQLGPADALFGLPERRARNFEVRFRQVARILGLIQLHLAHRVAGSRESFEFALSGLERELAARHARRLLRALQAKLVEIHLRNDVTLRHARARLGDHASLPATPADRSAPARDLIWPVATTLGVRLLSCALAICTAAAWSSANASDGSRSVAIAM